MSLNSGYFSMRAFAGHHSLYSEFKSPYGAGNDRREKHNAATTAEGFIQIIFDAVVHSFIKAMFHNGIVVGDVAEEGHLGLDS
ncbi:hypothetical protein PAXRUDRAFT_828336 [Paxillus rubicundulus Ve08.2h10]|uniref:Uncharacterized protein n=1 Tax=Paxillus rubicundulus Ve08.2h10 TaxID=930991 RepID=A0A0D0E7K2_9AGAM|nr:hypothetical protein PAXRUDRAFT_828336 [Paxillus rubicundulus Ve08.2h10]